MGEAKRDNNRIPTLMAVSNVDQTTPVVLWADPVTHRLLVTSDSQAIDTQGADIASATDLALGSDGDSFRVTGTTTISGIISTGLSDGAVIFLVFGASLTLKNNHGMGTSETVMFLKAGADESVSIGDTKVFKLMTTDSKKWYEF